VTGIISNYYKMTFFGTRLAYTPNRYKKGDIMIHKSIYLSILAAVLSLNSITEAQSTPIEITNQVITRTAQNQNTVSVRLSKNLFRTETQQVPYTVQVPYQETETYIEQVPYTVSVPYQDTETYYEQVPYTERVPYTEYVTDYRHEYQCHNVTRYRREHQCRNVTDYRRECRSEQKCYLVPGEPGQCRDVQECGTNVHGQPICKTKRVCDPGSGPQQRCENQQVCHNEPYTRQECSMVDVPYTDRECATVQVPFQREITKYRDETRYRQEARTRTVTKYREETRYREETKTRTVTKYRTEERCCKTESRQVFDRQLQYQVAVNFPQEALLNQNESESLTISLTSSEPGTISIQQNVSALYGYKIISQNASGEVINVQLGLIPLFNEKNAGADSIKNLSIMFSRQSERFSIQFTDKISHPKVQTQTQIEVLDLITNELIEVLSPIALGNGEFSATMQTQLNINTKIKAVLKVQRLGRVLNQGQVSFTQEAKYDKRTITTEDLVVLSDSSKVTLTAPITIGMSSYLKLVDTTEEIEKVQTTYVLSLFAVKNGQFKAINTPQTITRSQAIAANGEVTLARLLGKSAANILKPGQRLKAQIAVSRQIQNSEIGQPTPFTVVADIVIQ